MILVDTILSYFGYVRIDNKTLLSSIQLSMSVEYVLKKASMKYNKVEPYYKAQKALTDYLRSLRKITIDV